jgi:hypothetical protein
MIRLFTLPFLAMTLQISFPSTAAEIVGKVITPHTIEPTMRYRRPRDPSLAARIQLFVKGPAMPGRFNGKTPAQLLAEQEWSWHDLSTAVKSPSEEALTVWSFNGKSSRWGVGNAFQLEAEGLKPTEIPITAPKQWISSVTFLSRDGSVQPDTVMAYVANTGTRALKIHSLRLWLPKSGDTWQTLFPEKPIKVSEMVPSGEKGYVRISTRKLPLTYAAIELATSEGSLWAHLRIKREVFDISGGWIGEHIRQESYLHLLASMHINTGHISATPGYTDNPALYNRIPIKLFHKLDPISAFDTDEWLPRIHAVEFLGEPQYGGGRPVPPQEVFDQLLPYRASRLATTVTHSEEKVWRWYAGLSDYPHYDAYRVVAPAADAWNLYDRWGGRRIRWGAPLETIGDMCRSLRELNRPMPCAYWSQGPHYDWDNRFDGRKRRSPTPDELREQALHALSTRITSLYWFNLSLRSLMEYPDTWEAMRRIGREIRMLDRFYLEGDAYRFERRTTADGAPDWDLASIVSPSAGILFALDTAYSADPKENVFTFGAPRRAVFQFPLPHWLRKPQDLFRIDADGVHPTKWRATDTGVEIDDVQSRSVIYVAARDSRVRREIENRRRLAMEHESRHPVDRPALDRLFAEAMAKGSR